MEEDLPKENDFYLNNASQNKLNLRTFWSALWIFMLISSTVLSLYSAIKCANSNESSLLKKQIETIHQVLLDDEMTLSEHLGMIKNINTTHQNLLEKANCDCGETLNSIPIFDCYRTTRLTVPGVITFDGCHVDNTNGAIKKDTGIFTVSESGIYQISLTVKYVSSSNGRFGAWSDIYVNDMVIADSQREYNGNERSKMESSTHTIILFHPLVEEDLLKVQFNKDGNSFIHSDADHDLHFAVRKVADIR